MVGAGVIGLTVAVELLTQGHRVDVIARDLPRETTSSVAAGLWYPHLLEPDPRVLGWAATTYAVLAGLAGREPDSGVRLRPGTELLREPTEVPWWVSAVPDLLSVRDVPEPYDSGWRFVAPVAEMPRYLDFLLAQVHRLGGTLTRLNVSGLPRGADVVVDCAGLGAKHLGADPSVRPVRGQVVLVEQVGLETWWLDGAGPTYVVPREHDIVVGGTHEDGEWSRTPSPAATGAILARAMRLVPELVGAGVLGTRVGLRPLRPTVRLERDADRPEVVHCYGHGGAGVTLSWGCAREVAALLS